MAITSIKIGDKTFDIDYSKHNHTRSQITDVKSLKFGSKTYDGSAEKEITAADLGLGAALKFVGTTTTALTDGSTTTSVALSSGSTLTVSSTSNIGSVVFYGDKEFVWNGSSWEELGFPIDLSNYKTKQTAVSSPSASGNATAFIDSISQDANGNITVTKKNVSFPTIPTLSGGTAASNDATVVGGVTVSGHAVTVGKKTLKAGSNVTITGGSSEISIAAKDTTYSEATASTAGLMSANDKKRFNSVVPHYYGVCDTAENDAAKVVTIENFELVVGVQVSIKFTNKSAADAEGDALTLNINGTGALPMRRYGTTAMSTSTTSSGWQAGAVQTFTYDGSAWIREFWYNTTYSNPGLGQGYGTCSTAASTTAKTASISSYSLTSGGIVSIKFTYDVPASATLNITSKGAKSIYHKGAAIKAGVIKAGDTATFIYSSQYHLISIDREIPEVPASLKNPYSLTIQQNGTTVTNGTYDGSAAKTVNITVPTKVSDLTNDSGFTSNTGTVTGVKMNGTTKSPTSGVVDLGTVITSHQDISGKADKSSLATVATSGSYNDLTDKPTIPSAVTSSTVSGWGFTKNAGTITGITMNGASKGTSGVVDLGTVITSLDGYATQSWVEAKGYKTTDNDTKTTAGSSNKTATKLLLVGATSTTTGTTYTNSNCYVGTDNCLYSGGTKVLTAHQDISGKQDKLTSGTNIKTVNSNSLLGSGNISVGTITKVQANGTDVASSGTANIPAASTSAYGVTKLSSATNSTSTSLAATASAVKSAYDLANGKWTYNADTIKAVKVNNAVAADSASSVAWSGVTSTPTSLSGYGITDAYTKSTADGKFITGARSAYDVNKLYNAGIHMVASGSNVPCGSNYGVCLTLPYRGLYNNSKPDFGAQIFLPNGDDETKPNSMYFRTALADTWNAWQEVATKGSLATVATSGSYNDLSNKPTIPAAYKGNYSTSALTASSTSFTLNPNTYYTITPSSASTRTFSFGSATSGIVNEYIVEINMSSYAPTIAFPSSVVWANETAPEYTKGKKYIISIVNNYAVFAEF